jgi:hypothetical protein
LIKLFETGVGEQCFLILGDRQKKRSTSHRDQFLPGAGDGDIEAIRVVEEFTHHVVRFLMTASMIYQHQGNGPSRIKNAVRQIAAMLSQCGDSTVSQRIGAG